MCTCDVRPEATEALAALLADIAAALCPEDPRSVVVGPVDFGPVQEPYNASSPVPRSEPGDGDA